MLEISKKAFLVNGAVVIVNKFITSALRICTKFGGGAVTLASFVL